MSSVLRQPGPPQTDLSIVGRRRARSAIPPRLSSPHRCVILPALLCLTTLMLFSPLYPMFRLLSRSEPARLVPALHHQVLILQRQLPTQQPGHGGDHRQARPVQSSFDGILDPQYLSTQGVCTREENTTRGAPRASCVQMSFWTARAQREDREDCERCRMMTGLLPGRTAGMPQLAALPLGGKCRADCGLAEFVPREARGVRLCQT